MAKVPMIADGGELTVLQELASDVYGRERVDYPEQMPDEVKPTIADDHEFGYLYKINENVGRMARRWARADVSILAADFEEGASTPIPDSGFSDFEAVLDEASRRVSGDAMFQKEITREGLGPLVPFRDFNVGDVWPVLWCNMLLLELVVSRIEAVSELGAVADWRILMGQELVDDKAAQLRANDNAARALEQARRKDRAEARKANKNATAALQTANDARGDAAAALAAVEDAEGVIQRSMAEALKVEERGRGYVLEADESRRLAGESYQGALVALAEVNRLVDESDAILAGNEGLRDEIKRLHAQVGELYRSILAANQRMGALYGSAAASTALSLQYTEEARVLVGEAADLRQRVVKLVEEAQRLIEEGRGHVTAALGHADAARDAFSSAKAEADRAKRLADEAVATLDSVREVKKAADTTLVQAGTKLTELQAEAERLSDEQNRVSAAQLQELERKASAAQAAVDQAKRDAASSVSTAATERVKELEEAAHKAKSELTQAQQQAAQEAADRLTELQAQAGEVSANLTKIDKLQNEVLALHQEVLSKHGEVIDAHDEAIRAVAQGVKAAAAAGGSAAMGAMYAQLTAEDAARAAASALDAAEKNSEAIRVLTEAQAKLEEATTKLADAQAALAETQLKLVEAGKLQEQINLDQAQINETLQETQSGLERITGNLEQSDKLQNQAIRAVTAGMGLAGQTAMYAAETGEKAGKAAESALEGNRLNSEILKMHHVVVADAKKAADAASKTATDAQNATTALAETLAVQKFYTGQQVELTLGMVYWSREQRTRVYDHMGAGTKVHQGGLLKTWDYNNQRGFSFEGLGNWWGKVTFQIEFSSVNEKRVELFTYNIGLDKRGDTIDRPELKFGFSQAHMQVEIWKPNDVVYYLPVDTTTGKITSIAEYQTPVGNPFRLYSDGSIEVGLNSTLTNVEKRIIDGVQRFYPVKRTIPGTSISVWPAYVKVTERA